MQDTLSSDKDLKRWRKQCFRQIKRSLKDRLDYGFIYTYKPVMDDAPSRVFSTMRAYRKWCSKNLPPYLGYAANAARKSV